MGLITMENIGREGIRGVASSSGRRLAESADWIVCHLDVDALDQNVMPAVNYPTPGGMTTDQVVTAIKELKATEKLRVLEVSAYNPDFDKSGLSAEVVVGLVRESLHL